MSLTEKEYQMLKELASSITPEEIELLRKGREEKIEYRRTPAMKAWCILKEEGRI